MSSTVRAGSIIDWADVANSSFTTNGNWVGKWRRSRHRRHGVFQLFQRNLHGNVCSSVTNTGLTIGNGTVSFTDNNATTAETYTQTGTTTIGGSANGTSLTLTGTTRRLTLAAAALFVEAGTAPSGALPDITQGNLVTAGSLDVGQLSGGDEDGSVIVDGTNGNASPTASTLTVNGSAVIGQSGASGSVTIQNSAKASFFNMEIDSALASNTSGIFTVQSGATATASGVSLGDVAGSGQTAQFTVSGTNSKFTQTGASAFTMGSTTGSAATMNVNFGAVYTSGTGDFDLFNSGTVTVGGANFGSGATFNALGAINVNGGTFNLANGIVNASSNITVSGNGMLSVASSGDLSWTNGKTLTINSGGQVDITPVTSTLYQLPALATVNISGSGSGASTLKISNGGRADCRLPMVLSSVSLVVVHCRLMQFSWGAETPLSRP